MPKELSLIEEFVLLSGTIALDANTKPASLSRFMDNTCSLSAPCHDLNGRTAIPRNTNRKQRPGAAKKLTVSIEMLKQEAAADLAI